MSKLPYTPGMQAEGITPEEAEEVYQWIKKQEKEWFKKDNKERS